MTVADLIAELQALPTSAQSAEVVIAWHDSVMEETVSDAVGRVVYERGEVNLISENADDD